MRKNQLIKKLQKIEGNPLIICASDAEGNDFSPLSDVVYDEESYWDKEVAGFVDVSVPTKGQRKKLAIVLFRV